MKKIILCAMLFLATYAHAHESRDEGALEPNITREQRWQEYEKRRVKIIPSGVKIAEFFYEWKESFKHSFWIDVLFCKSNRIETPLCEEVLKKFERNLSNITVLHKPMHKEACSLLNTIIIDHDKMSKFTAEEQAFLLGHEVARIKSWHLLTRILYILAIELGSAYLIGELIKNEPAAGVLWILAQASLLIPTIHFLSRLQEKRYDTLSAKTLGLARAGISALEKKRKELILRQEAPMNPNGIWYNMINFFGYTYHVTIA